MAMIPAYLAYSDLKSIQDEFNSSTSSKMQLKKYKSILSELKENALIKDSNSYSQRNRLLNYAESNVDEMNVQLIEINSLLNTESDNYKFQYNKLSIKGSFQNQLRFYYKYEQNKLNDKLVSLIFFSKFNNKIGKNELFSESLIVSIIKNTEI